MQPLFMGGLLLSSFLTIMLIVVQVKQDNSIGNFTWGGGVMLLTLFTFFYSGLYLPRHVLITSLVLLWGMRLATHAWARYKKGADPRFVAWQNQWGRYALLVSFGWIFLLNGFMALLMSSPAIVVNRSILPGLTWLDFLATAIWAIGFFFESVGDYQLFTFIKNPANKGKILKTGLWRYSRHPNYFGEIVMWWSLYLIALNVPNGWMTIVAPLAITITLVFVTGIPWIEQVFDNNPEYQQYKKETSMLIPWFVKK